MLKLRSNAISHLSWYLPIRQNRRKSSPIQRLRYPKFPIWLQFLGGVCGTEDDFSAIIAKAVEQAIVRPFRRMVSLAMWSILWLNIACILTTLAA